MVHVFGMSDNFMKIFSIKASFAINYGSLLKNATIPVMFFNTRANTSPISKV